MFGEFGWFYEFEDDNKGFLKTFVRSYGILLMELFTYGQIPYPGMANREVISIVDRGDGMPKPSNHHLPKSIFSVMLQCWDKLSAKRPTFEYLSNFFGDFSTTSEEQYREVEGKCLPNKKSKCIIS